MGGNKNIRHFDVLIKIIKCPGNIKLGSEVLGFAICED